MTVRYIPKDDWFIEEYSDCQMCGCDKPYSEDWYCDECNKSIESERQKVSCKCATFEPEEGRYSCSVSGDGCVFLYNPDSKRCAELYGEGPDVDLVEEAE